MRTSFMPLTHGYHFSNMQITWSAGFMSGTALCGGMSFSSLDYFYNNLTIPGLAHPPEEGTPLHDYIYNRQMHAHNYAIPILLSGRSHWGANDVNTSHSGSAAFGALRQYLYYDRPIPILLGDAQNPVSTNSHWVVAIGYEEDAGGDCAKIYLYDNNYPDVVCEIIPVLSTGHVVHSNTSQRYGFYVPYPAYSPHDPRVPVQSSIAPAAMNALGNPGGNIGGF